MQRNIQRGIEVYREEGVVAFARKTSIFLVAPVRKRKRQLYRRPEKARGFLRDLYFCLSFICGGAGHEYGVTPVDRLKLLRKIKANNRKIPTLTIWHQHVILAEAILNVPQNLKGDVVECGVFNGASTTTLSLVCSLVGRKLFVCDSFVGLPSPEESERFAIVSGTKTYYQWRAGEYASEGGLRAVQNTVSKFGSIEVCEFVSGYFSDTLNSLNTDSIVLVFEDADMHSSVKDCIISLWPKLREGCKFYCHEPWSIAVVGLFYDKDLWNLSLGLNPPGFFGSGYGLSIGPVHTRMGYARKVNQAKILDKGVKRVMLGTEGYQAKRK